MTESGLKLSGLSVQGPGGKTILNNIGFEVSAGEIVGLVGESGSGKSMTTLALGGILPKSIQPSSGSASLDGAEFMRHGRVVQRSGISIVFQNAKAALNPTMRIGKQFTRLLVHIDPKNKRGASQRIEQLLLQVGILDTSRVARAYPHQLSGGMNQRIMIAMALASEPSMLIADEPTTGLDVTVQAQILQLIKETVAETSRGVLLITHDLGVVAQMCTKVVVMYRGEIVEIGPVDDIFHNPSQDYTRELVSSVMPDSIDHADREEGS